MPTTTTTSFNDLPEWIQHTILESLEDFNVHLKSRLVCKTWNTIVASILSPRTILNIRMDSTPACKRFRRGKWDSSLILQPQEIRIIPKQLNAFAYGKARERNKSALKYFTQVKKLTVFENGSFLHFVHRYMPLLPKLKYVQVKELHPNTTTGSATEECDLTKSKYTYLGHVYVCAVRHLKSWYKAQENIAQVETLRVRLFDRLATLIYIQAFTFRTCGLINVELDFSHLHGIPLERNALNELNSTVCDLLDHCYLTLKQLRLKWALRTDTDIDYTRSEENIEPFFEFLLSLRNPIWSRLNLDFLHLSFPTLNLSMNLAQTFLFPVLEKIVSRGGRVNLSRVLPNAGMESFVRAMPPGSLNRFEFSFYFMDTDVHPQHVPVIRSIEMLLMSGLPLDHTLVASLSRIGLSGSRHLHQLKLITAHNNFSYTRPNLFILTEYFPNLKVVELLDSSAYAKGLTHQFTADDFNLLVLRLPRLTTLRMANAGGLEDSRVTKISVEHMNRMKNSGSFYYHPNRDNNVAAPVAGAKELRYLDLRDLSHSVTDFSVFFAFQHVRKLEKVAFHGEHHITDWGKRLLERRKARNPCFGVLIRDKSSSDYDDFMIGNYCNPCNDFP